MIYINNRGRTVLNGRPSFGNERAILASVRRKDDAPSADALETLSNMRDTPSLSCRFCGTSVLILLNQKLVCARCGKAVKSSADEVGQHADKALPGSKRAE
jgi:hypothetical protein